MDLHRQNRVFRPLLTAAVVVLGGLLAYGCRRDETAPVDRNLPPETFITDGPEISPDPSNPTDLFYRAHLYWRGEDRDGTIVGFRYAIDDTFALDAWKYTTKTDSVFRFQTGEVGSRSHLFLLRAVDNLGKQDPSPDSLRFEAFTVATPEVRFNTAAIKVEDSNGTHFGLSPGDTVLVNSTITFVWSGSDADGEVVRWETVSGAEQPREHALDDTTRTVGPLPSGRHDFLVRAIDDAGAVSRVGGLFTVWSNHDPICHVDSTSIRSQLGITWLDSDPDVDSVLVMSHDLTVPGAQDTIPYGATVSFCWECTDEDGPIVLYNWTAGFRTGQTTEQCVDTDSVCAFDPDSGYVVCGPQPVGPEGTLLDFKVKARDAYGRVPVSTPTVVMNLNFAPSATIDPWGGGTIRPTTPVQFGFHGFDLDSNPSSLRFRWWFDGESPPGSYVSASQTDIRLFTQGTHRVQVQAIDFADRESEVAVRTFDVAP